METVIKKWGQERIIWNTDICGKFLDINSGWRCSDHRHHYKFEVFHILAGSCYLKIGDNLVHAKAGETFEVPTGVYHWFGCPSVLGDPEEVACTILEISTHHMDSDVERRRESEPFKYSTSLLVDVMRSVPPMLNETVDL